MQNTEAIKYGRRNGNRCTALQTTAARITQADQLLWQDLKSDQQLNNS